MAPKIHKEAPDGGWGWMVVLANFLQAALVFGLIRSFGVFFVEFVRSFDELSSRVSWITSIGLAIQQFASKSWRFEACKKRKELRSEVVAYHYDNRPTWPTPKYGALPLGLPYFCHVSEKPSTVPLEKSERWCNILYVCCTSVSLLGLGWALVFTPSVGSLTRYFKRRRTLATGLAFTGVGLSSFAFSPLFQYLVDTYSWRGGLLILSGMSLNLLVCGALLRPLTLEGDVVSMKEEEEERKGGFAFLRKTSALLDLSLLLHCPFMTFVMAVTLINTGYFVPYVHFVAHAQQVGFDEYKSAFLMSVAAITDLIGRLLSGWFSDLGKFQLAHILVTLVSLTGVSIIVIPLGRSYAALLAMSAFYGFFSGAMTPVVFSLLPEIIGITRIYGGLGLFQMIESIGGLLGAPLSGWLHDITHSYTISFVVAGGFLVLGSLVLCALPGFFSCAAPLVSLQPAPNDNDPGELKQISYCNGLEPEPQNLTIQPNSAGPAAPGTESHQTKL
nr:PREDICTED: monocarboxylate transporter 13-like [Latimeria chalumnae]|eukprot:XP_014346133.1 PREDICTED: monocarboxylate transporter 13-like [Latimeria chalumnae]